MAYNTDWLDRLNTISAAAKLQTHGLITDDQLRIAREQLRHPLYTPGFFVRIGLFLFSLIVVGALIGLVGVTISSVLTSEIAAGIFFMLMGAGCIAGLEYFTGTRNHYRSGIDDSLLYVSIINVIVGIVMISGLEDALVICFICLPLLIAATWRYMDSLTALAGMAVLYAIVYLLAEQNILFLSWLPILFMTVSLACILACELKLRQEIPQYYRNILQVLKVASLLMLYISGNYAAVREFYISWSGYEIIPVSRGYLLSTFLFPFLFMYLGMKRRDRLFIWSGLMVLVAADATLKYRYPYMPLENLLVLSGAVILFVAWGTIRYLRRNPGTFTDDEKPGTGGESLLQLEGFVIGTTMGHQDAPATEGPEFGGGKFGGGGAGG